MTTARVIGSGPAGLMAAEVLARHGVTVRIAEQMPSVGRKFLMAGKSGLNLTKNEPRADFNTRITPRPAALKAALDAFGPEEAMAWATGLGQTIFTGSTGRVFPTVMKASPLLRAWLARLDELGARLDLRWRWTGWEGEALTFETPDGPHHEVPDITILALGGASWRRLGSDGAWADWIGPVMPFKPSNVGLHVTWSAHMARHLGAPVKGVSLTAGELQSRGEFVLSKRGLEGGGIYEVSAAVRDGATLTLDLLPDRSLEQLRRALERPRGKASLSNYLRKTLGLDPVRIALFNEWGRSSDGDLAATLKCLTVHHDGPRPLDEAISTAGGLPFDRLNAGLMLRDRPGTFVAGEMLDWEAPTGGYLITTCLATGAHAAHAALQHTGDALPNA